MFNVKALLGTFNQEKTFSEKALSVIIKTDGSFAALVVRAEGACQNGNVLQIFGVGETVAAGADWWGAQHQHNTH